MEERTEIAAADLGLGTADVERIRTLYNGRYAQHGHAVATVGWGSKADQELRFEVLCRGLDLRQKRVLDVGCGLGDFVAYARRSFGDEFSYVGIDLAADLIGAARRQYGDDNCEFAVATLAEDFAYGEFDICVMSGTLSFRTQDNDTTMRRMLALAWQRAREAVCANFLSTYVDFTLEKNFHFKPEDVFSYGRSLTRWVRLHHDYPLHEFTIQLFKSPNPQSLSAR